MTSICYFTELESPELASLFGQPEVMNFLTGSGAAVAVGILDLSEERAAVVQSLNQAGVPVTAWLLLPKNQGYWFNLDNAYEAASRYREFLAWSQQNNLRWERIGMDIEPDINALMMASKAPLVGAWHMLRRTTHSARLHHGVQAYQALVREIHADGYAVETYQFPFIIDERTAHSNFLQRMTGMVDLPAVDREVLMLYSSFSRPWGQGILWSYAPQAGAIAVGSTGGGVALEGSLATPPLNWAELQTDLLLAYQHTDRIYVFSLEGCVRQGFLPQLQQFNWQQEIQPPVVYAARVYRIRQSVQRALWLAKRPALLLFGMAMLVSALALVTRRKR
jgi:hypothetical protein